MSFEVQFMLLFRPVPVSGWTDVGREGGPEYRARQPFVDGRKRAAHCAESVRRGGIIPSGRPKQGLNIR